MATSFPVEPVRTILLNRAAAQGLSISELAVVLRLPRRTLHRLLTSRRMRWDTADRVAIALGHHPSELWPNWYDGITEWSG